ANLISLVFQAIHFTSSGSIENSCRASELGASYTQINRCSGTTVQAPILLTLCFFSSPTNLAGNSRVMFHFLIVKRTVFCGMSGNYKKYRHTSTPKSKSLGKSDITYLYA